MATLDFGLLGLNQPGIAERFYQGQQEAQRNALAQQQLQGAQIQNQTAQMQYEQAKRDREALDTMAKLFAQHGQTGSLSENFDKMIASGIPQYVQVGIAGKQKLAEQAQFAQIMGGGAPAPAAAPTAVGPSAPVAAPAAPTNALAPQAAPAAPAVNALAPAVNADMLRRKRDQLLALGTPQAIAAARALDTDIVALQRQHTVAPGGTVVGPSGEVLYKAPEKEPTATAVTEYNFARSPAGGNFKGSFQDFMVARARAGAAPAQPQPPVEVVDPATGKPVFVTREEAISKRMTPAKAMEGLSPKEIQTREAKFPQATATIKTFESKSDQLAKDLETLANHPGLSGISGIVGGRTPALTSEARQAQALYDSIVARGGFSELQSMRQASPTGGALGNVSNQENVYLRDAFGALNRTQDTPDLAQALKNAATQVRNSTANIREAYDLTYAYKRGGAGPAAAPAAGVAAPPKAAVDALLSGAGTDAQFDEIFGPGAAKRARGK